MSVIVDLLVYLLIFVSTSQSDLVNALLPRDAADNSNAILEVRAGLLITDMCTPMCLYVCRLVSSPLLHDMVGAGGQEASLFTATVYQMYQK